MPKIFEKTYSGMNGKKDEEGLNTQRIPDPGQIRSFKYLLQNIAYLEPDLCSMIPLNSFQS